MRRTLLAAALLVIALAACSDDDDGVATDTTAGTSNATTSRSAATSSTTAVAGSTSTTIGSSSSTAAEGTPLECGTVGFTPNSEDAASSITVSGGTCDEAKAFVEVAGTLTSSGGPASVDVRGYRCVRTRSVDDPLPAATYSCTRAGTTITFVRT